MTNSIIQIDASKTQLSKLKKGCKVNLKKGDSYHMHVSPQHAKSFNKKGKLSIQLNPELLELNKKSTTIEKGKGIFGHTFDDMMERNGFGKEGKVLEEIAKPHIKRLAHKGIDYLTSKISKKADPSVSNFVNSVSKSYVNDYLDNPHVYLPRKKTTGKGLTECLSGSGFYAQGGITGGMLACPFDKQLCTGNGLFMQGGMQGNGVGHLAVHSMENGSIGLGGSILHALHPALHPNQLDCHFGRKC